jgi:hypothetical protein
MRSVKSKGRAIAPKAPKQHKVTLAFTEDSYRPIQAGACLFDDGKVDDYLKRGIKLRMEVDFEAVNQVPHGSESLNAGPLPPEVRRERSLALVLAHRAHRE